MHHSAKTRSQTAVLPRNSALIVSAGISNLLRSAGIAVAGSAFIALCAHISIPLFFTPVPVTLQPFAVLALGLLLSPELAMAATAAYLAEGALGLPVFTPHGPGGLLQLLGPTGGYLLSYPLVAPVVASLWRRVRPTYFTAFAIAGGGSLVTLAAGAAWLALITHAAPQTILTQAILPFLPGDALKVAAAAGLAMGARRFRRR